MKTLGEAAAKAGGDRPVDVETVHDRYMAAAAAFRDCPTPRAARDVAEAYRRFWRAFNGTSAGLDAALVELRYRMAREIRRAA